MMTILLITDVKDILNKINHETEIKETQCNLMIRIVEFLQFHSNAKQLSHWLNNGNLKRYFIYRDLKC